MRGTKAKRLRAIAGYRPGTSVSYGQQESSKMVSRLVREKGPFGTFKMVMKKVKQTMETGARICLGPRSVYKLMKKSFR